MRYVFCFLSLLLIRNAFATEIDIADKISYDVEVAQTREQQVRGLMYERHLDENRGMLFDFRGNDNVSMWMKNTYIPLDMIFLDCRFKVVDIYQGAMPMSEEEITSGEKFCYVLEVNAGQVKEHHIEVGDIAKLYNH